MATLDKPFVETPSRRHRMRKTWHAILITIVFFSATIAVAEPANADPFGTCTTDTGCRADDANMDYCTAYPWSTFWGAPFGDAMVNLNAQTDMYETYEPVCRPNTDIGGYLNASPEYPYGIPGYRGVFICTKHMPNDWYACDQGSLILNASELPDQTQARKTLCHEIGHAAGLTHGPDYGGCMVSGTSTNITYSAHHVWHINLAY